MIKVTFTDFSRGIYHKEVKLKQSTFPAGERYIKIDEESRKELERSNFIVSNIELLDSDSDSIFDMILLSNAISEINNYISQNLTMYYLPYGRQDRVCSRGESNSLVVFMKIISPMFKNIFIWDAHNPKALQRFDNVYCLTPDYFRDFSGLFPDKTENLQELDFNETSIVRVDIGATGRCLEAKQQIREKLGAHLLLDILELRKSRFDGKVTQVIEKYVDAKNYIIFDDICDGGRTFLNAADLIKKQYPDSKIYLVISHGIFSAGLSALKETFEQVFLFENQYNKNRLAKILSKNFN